jgi:twitching motility protein PilU
MEVMLLTPYVSELIQKGQIDEIKTAIARSGEQGMCTFNQSLFELYERGVISPDEAVANADNRTDVSLRLRLASGAPLGVDGMRMSDPSAEDAPARP